MPKHNAQLWTLTRTPEIGDYFEAAVKVSGDGPSTANWMCNDLMGMLKKAGKEISESPIKPEQLGELVALINKGELSGKLAKEILSKMFETGDSISAIMEREGLEHLSDRGFLVKIVDEVLTENSKQVEQYKSGKTTVIGFLVGQVLKACRGQANPVAVNEMLKNKLS